MIQPLHIWKYTGSWPFSIPGVEPKQIEKHYPGLTFDGVGWYAQYKLLIEELTPGRYSVSKYDTDPRPELNKIVKMENK